MPIDPSAMGPAGKPNLPKPPEETAPKDPSGKTFSQHAQEAGAKPKVYMDAQTEHAYKTWFPQLHFTRTEFKQFMKGLLRSVSQAMQRDQRRMKKAEQEMKKAIDQ